MDYGMSMQEFVDSSSPFVSEKHGTMGNTVSEKARSNLTGVVVFIFIFIFFAFNLLQ